MIKHAFYWRQRKEFLSTGSHNLGDQGGRRTPVGSARLSQVPQVDDGGSGPQDIPARRCPLHFTTKKSTWHILVVYCRKKLANCSKVLQHLNHIPSKFSGFGRRL